MNDFDETLPGPWEWDVKRLAASVAIAARQKGLPRDRQREAAELTVRGYREAMLSFAGLATMDLWYLHMSTAQFADIAAQLELEFGVRAPKLAPDRLQKIFARARSRDNLGALAKLCQSDGTTVRQATRSPSRGRLAARCGSSRPTTAAPLEPNRLRSPRPRQPWTVP